MSLRNGSIAISIIVILVYGIIFNVENDSGFTSLVQEGFLWLMCLVGTILEILAHIKYNSSLKEYIDYQNKRTMVLFYLYNFFNYYIIKRVI